VQRHDLAVKETEQLNGDLKELEKRTGREVDSLKAVIEETEIRVAEIRKEIYDFNRVLGTNRSLVSRVPSIEYPGLVNVPRVY
jgi:hypothetical protein